jgi:hypothetical protein
VNQNQKIMSRFYITIFKTILIIFLILLFIHIIILTLTHLGLDSFPSFTAHCIEHSPITNRNLSIKFNDNDIVYRIENEINNDIEIENRNSCTNKETTDRLKDHLIVGVPLSIAVTI